MSSSSSKGVTVIWDYQYAWIPEGYDLRTLKANIETALKKYDPDFFIEGKLIAVGTATGDKHQAITMLPNDIELSPMPDYHTRGPDRDLADQAAVLMVMKMGRKLLTNTAANILIISGNDDLMYAINGWIKRGIFIMLALLENSIPCFYHCANVTWLWTSDDTEAAAASTMVNGGGPIPPAPRIRG